MKQSYPTTLKSPLIEYTEIHSQNVNWRYNEIKQGQFSWKSSSKIAYSQNLIMAVNERQKFSHCTDSYHAQGVIETTANAKLCSLRQKQKAIELRVAQCLK
jgi:hypothetical protein